ncbi:uncharacterized protein TrAtP1_008329 [Trichoderma atroviride]|uniref:RING-type E3 ubiquitin transferase n=1 Tax=Hypocrea atroviridis (strain ATCC 20476 / IMI 206040) TaxID=452589 RepID=G9NZI5_HYPAI|nr:uncharacterized protein TRIATDRAFT_300278 [Trichoderma atroviride IMI 206040]EHK43890.1 hypothetical protein TRIATDRAFT_300278 [Trichoderma atroviride IMI 206040]UKZ67166.1 hypothetical protein TrAtP1_008329 [Trichoderma atroviride]
MESGPTNENDEIYCRILQNTLQEVAAREQSDNAATCCVICLDTVSDACELLPCGHDSFDYLCILNWLYDKPLCPLCKGVVAKVQRGPPEHRETTIIEPKPQPSPTRTYSHQSSFPRPRARATRTPRFTTQNDAAERVQTLRRDVYLQKRFSKHVGSNRLSLYRELTPRLFCRDEHLVSRARMWIRRELQVFSFLTAEEPTAATATTSAASRPDESQARRRANNAEFLLEYIIAILKSVDIMGSAGQAEDMLSDFLGRDNTRVFLHELRSWLRSPFAKLEDWDRAVQYDPVPSEESPSRPAPARNRNEGAPQMRHTQNQMRSGGDYYRPGPARGSREEMQKSRREPYAHGRRRNERGA